MERISPRLIPVSNLLVLVLSAFGKEIIDAGFCGIEMPQSLEAMVKTRLKMVSSLFKEEGETS